MSLWLVDMNHRTKKRGLRSAWACGSSPWPASNRAELAAVSVIAALPATNANSQPLRPPETGRTSRWGIATRPSLKGIIYRAAILLQAGQSGLPGLAGRSVQLREERDQQWANSPEFLAMRARESPHQ